MGSDTVPPLMVSRAFRATSHLAAWLVWHTTGVSLLGDLKAPAPPKAHN